ncbi:Uncharacterized protein TCM_029833 isoform 1 [Theobroma cacao]|uniref:Uncharacterized protein isoform 1 n=1 Tax=Theobroma cacao TaxID=3641 RepID=A0A061GF78_THECC|nr:Uncharacterized protein TCM_029833 isoform 1 [Theobroma cacao]
MIKITRAFRCPYPLTNVPSNAKQDDINFLGSSSCTITTIVLHFQLDYIRIFAGFTCQN